MEIDRGCLFLGIAIGFIIAAVIGQFLARIGAARNAKSAPDRPMSVPTPKTPRVVMSAAARGTRDMIFWTLALVAFSGFVLAVMYFVFFY